MRSSPLSRRIAATGLVGRTEGAPVSLDTGEWKLLLARLVNERLSGLAVAAADEGWLRLTAEQDDELLGRHGDAMVWTLRVEQALLRVTRGLEADGVNPIVLKGPVLAHTLYPDSSWRPFRDMDLLVPQSQWRAACASLQKLGMRRRLPEPRPGFDERFAKAVVFVGAEGIEVDLHRTLSGGPFGLWMDVGALLERTCWLELAGRRLRRMDDTALLLHACVHASLGWMPPELLPLRDVAQIATIGNVDWEALEALAARSRLRVVVAHAFAAVQEVFGDVLPPPALRLMETEAPRVERRALLAYTTDRRWRGDVSWFTLRAISGVRAKTAYVRALMFPTREFVTARAEAGHRGSYLRRWAVPVRWLRGSERRS